MTIDMLHFQQLIFKWSEKRKQSTSVQRKQRRFSPEGDGGSGRRPLPPNHFTFW